MRAPVSRSRPLSSLVRWPASQGPSGRRSLRPRRRVPARLCAIARTGYGLTSLVLVKADLGQQTARHPVLRDSLRPRTVGAVSLIGLVDEVRLLRGMPVPRRRRAHAAATARVVPVIAGHVKPSAAPGEGRRQLIAYYFMWFPGQPAAEQCEGACGSHR